MIEIKEISMDNKKDFKAFFKFPVTLYMRSKTGTENVSKEEGIHCKLSFLRKYGGKSGNWKAEVFEDIVRRRRGMELQRYRS